MATQQKLKLSFTEAEFTALRSAVPKGKTMAGFIREVIFARAELEVAARPLVTQESVAAALDKGLKGLKSGRAKPGVFERVRRRHGLTGAKPRTPS